MLSVEEARSRLHAAGQPHVLRFWSELAPQERSSLLAEVATLDPDWLAKHCRDAAAEAKATLGNPDSVQRLDERMEPVAPEFLGSVKKNDTETLQSWQEQGLLQISENKVAVLLLAGGQGTRLGVSYPKGMYNVGLPSGKTLYQIQAERIRKVEMLAAKKRGVKCTVPWYIMTSEFTLSPTEKFFEENGYFGLDKSNVIMFEQRMIPAVSFDGKVILEAKSKIAMAPDGNGGLYQALDDNQILEDMERRGIQYIHVYCVDNILVKMADPVFIGFCVEKGADCGAKVVEKAYPTEPVGVVCRVDGVYQVVEYSEITLETAEKQDAFGSLVYSAGNICNHFFTLHFLKSVSEKFKDKLKQHIAIKKVPYVDEDGNLVKPLKPNGIKMEKFVFDVFQFSKNFVAFEVLREEEFSPLKNADTAAQDNPTTARCALLCQHYRWALKGGARFTESENHNLTENLSLKAHENPSGVIEISPLVSYWGEGLEMYLKDRVINGSVVLDEKEAEEMLKTKQH
ncbi:UDP-N-acetylhexosamine pyrophosphorylase-like protein 1 [Polypterus senegalus]|uniref:UDP-N-acetylhexosamine pyrophosphorylase-like protein 1 n=1 Tax=Polypterus senegalus TaxID=55291 RepID=UPI001965DF5C|nr:UDP-N-acetylhexosamine pyrophosphorylase-like protein 1 [Polypterus senegalus]